MESCSDPETASDTFDEYRLNIQMTDLSVYIIRFLMGISFTAYLIATRKKRVFPRFVILQLLLIDLEYILATGLQMWTVIHYRKE